MSGQTAPSTNYLRVQGTPRNTDAQGLTPSDHTDLKILYNNNGVEQRVIHTKLFYHDHNGHEKFVVAAVYEVVHETLPPRLPSLLPPPAHPAYVIRDAPGKGKGVFATRDIAEGEIVITERPIIMHPIVTTSLNGSSYDQLRDYARKSMDPQDWKNVNDLMNWFDNDSRVSKLWGILITNSFGFRLGKEKEKERYGGLFLDQSRINHSCGPNLAGSWNSHLFVRAVQAVRPIRAGQELTISYEDLGDSHANRRYDLERKYKFQCACGYCTKTSPTSDVDRSVRHENGARFGLEYLYSQVIEPNHCRCGNYRRAKNFIDFLIKDLVLLRKEGIESMAGMWTYLYLMKTHGLCGDIEMFKKWGFKAVLLSCGFYVNMGGEKARLEVEQWINWIKEPKTFPEWGILRGTHC